ncbi:hypothetical protein OESDEN_06302 [Oesophagostomum dentatum]|uniref:Uncharacterized protein n=1 Tax=Oesophagostomum dentatum TaxID=61180 RepID=A0A0B1TCE6_OESDE|nr:hypothetical protein OESDEN_06302 [Oesophagostomum dentatum]
MLVKEDIIGALTETTHSTQGDENGRLSHLRMKLVYNKRFGRVHSACGAKGWWKARRLKEGLSIRVFERKTEDNFKWHDDRGRLLDEKSEKSWKVGDLLYVLMKHNLNNHFFHGELDTVLRDGPDQARQWSRRMEVLPTGDTRFQDVRRQYNNNFVVESIVRNY